MDVFSMATGVRLGKAADLKAEGEKEESVWV